MHPAFDLAAYFARIGLESAPTADATGIDAIQRAHRSTIAFENLDIPLGHGISLEPDRVFGKLVTRCRGGYCFEQNQLFLRALRALGFEARPLMARVWLGAEGIPPRTHTLNLVEINGVDWIADAGFGGGYVPPLPLAEAEPVTTPDEASHRLRRDPDHGWTLERRGSAALTDGRTAPSREGWLQQYSFSLDQVAPADLEIANHWTASRPDTRFTTLQVISIARPTGFASMVDGMLTMSENGRKKEQIATATAYGAVLRDDFNLAVDDDQAARLFNAIA